MMFIVQSKIKRNSKKIYIKIVIVKISIISIHGI